MLIDYRLAHGLAGNQHVSHSCFSSRAWATTQAQSAHRFSRSSPLWQFKRCAGPVACAERSSENEQDNRHVFGAKGYVAGIPVSVKATPCGLRLRHTLQHRPHEFVAAAMQELQVAVSELVATAEQGDQRRTALSAVFEDVLYHWALAEAYLHHPEMQAFMREKLGRQPSKRPLAAGDDGMLLESRVQLLQGPLYEGRYMIGSVRFEREQQAEDRASSNGRASTSGDSLQWGGRPGDAFMRGGEIQPALEAVFGSKRARAMTSVEGDALSRMDREGAARTYHTFVYCGYFNRRMKQKMTDMKASAGFSPLLATLFAPKQPPAGNGTPPGGTTPMPGSQQGLPPAPATYGSQPGEEQGLRPVESGYGEVAPVWRFFEQVPNSMTSPRTQQAAAVAQRHLRALFGSSTECITTLQAWQQMCTEARWFGRALFDAEQLVVAASQQFQHEMQVQGESGAQQ